MPDSKQDTWFGDTVPLPLTRSRSSSTGSWEEVQNPVDLLNQAFLREEAETMSTTRPQEMSEEKLPQPPSTTKNPSSKPTLSVGSASVLQKTPAEPRPSTPLPFPVHNQQWPRFAPRAFDHNAFKASVVSQARIEELSRQVAAMKYTPAPSPHPTQYLDPPVVSRPPRGERSSREPTRQTVGEASTCESAPFSVNAGPSKLHHEQHMHCPSKRSAAELSTGMALNTRNARRERPERPERSCGDHWSDQQPTLLPQYSKGHVYPSDFGVYLQDWEKRHQPSGVGADQYNRVRHGSHSDRL